MSISDAVGEYYHSDIRRIQNDLRIALRALKEVGISEGCWPGAHHELSEEEMDRLNKLVDAL